VAQRDVDHLLSRRHLEVERQLELAHQAFDVVVDDVPAVLAQVGGDAVGAGGLGDARGPERIGQPAAARVAHRGDVIDVHSEAQGVGRRHIILFEAPTDSYNSASSPPLEGEESESCRSICCESVNCGRARRR
jgi:hypothetical protein